MQVLRIDYQHYFPEEIFDSLEELRLWLCSYHDADPIDITDDNDDENDENNANNVDDTNDATENENDETTTAVDDNDNDIDIFTLTLDEICDYGEWGYKIINNNKAVKNDIDIFTLTRGYKDE